MASILKVNTIKDATNSNTAISVDSSGRVTRPNTPLVAVRTTYASYFGTNHGSATLDLNYRSPLPTFLSANRTTIVNQGGGTLSFHSYAGGEYPKYVVPTTGIYEYTFYGGMRIHSNQAGDWVAMGIYINKVTEASSGNIDYLGSVLQVYNPQDAVDDVQGNMSFTLQLSLNANDYIVPAQQSTGEACYETSHGFSVKLIG